MAKYTQCPNCGNSEEGDSISKHSPGCGGIFCSACSTGPMCPHCDEPFGVVIIDIKRLGYITAEEEESEDDDAEEDDD